MGYAIFLVWMDGVFHDFNGYLFIIKFFNSQII